MPLTESFVLPLNAALIPAADLPEDLRRASGAEDGDFALSLTNSRSLSKIVDADSAALIREFEKPATIPFAIARFSRNQRADPEQILEDALPMLQSLIAEGILVPSGSASEHAVIESLAADDQVDEWIVVRNVQSLEDTELYVVRGPFRQLGALKIVRPQQNSAATAVAREARLLRSLTSPTIPMLLGHGTWQERPYLVTEWFPGVESQQAAAGLRAEDSTQDSRARLLHLGAEILKAYTALHHCGVVHGDVHSRNVLVARDFDVKLIDFGMARNPDELLPEILLSRAGVSFFFEPEYAAAALTGHRSPPPSFLGEQYAVAALLYFLITGKYSQDFSLERREMLQQIATGKMASFAERGVEPWAEVERLLEKALSREPASRFASMKEFSAEWSVIASSHSAVNSQLRQLRQNVLRRAAIGGEWFTSGFQTAPTTSVNYGSAGLACGLTQIAAALDDGELLAAADAWSAKSLTNITADGAFHNESLDVTANTVGKTSLYHGPAGVYVTEALLAAARGDLAAQLSATEKFAAHLNESLLHLGPIFDVTPIFDLTLGSAGSLLGAVFLLDALPKTPSMPVLEQARVRLHSLGQQLFDELWSVLDTYASIGKPTCTLANLGMAHGWAGLLYASLCWCDATDAQVPATLVQRLEQLAARSEPDGRGYQWRWPGALIMHGWCNGAAGFVFLWTTCHSVLSDDRYLALAEGAARSVAANPSRIANLCCGLAGQSYALLNLYRHTGDPAWLARAQQFADQAAKSAAQVETMPSDTKLELRPESLYKGEVGIAALDADLHHPLEARMPLFERQ